MDSDLVGDVAPQATHQLAVSPAKNADLFCIKSHVASLTVAEVMALRKQCLLLPQPIWLFVPFSKGPSIIVNIKLSVQTILFWGRGVSGNKCRFCTLSIFESIFLSFSWQILYLKTIDYVDFWGKGLRKSMICTLSLMLTIM